MIIGFKTGVLKLKEAGHSVYRIWVTVPINFSALQEESCDNKTINKIIFTSNNAIFYKEPNTQLQTKLIWPQKCRMSNCSDLPLVHFYHSGGTSINSSLHISALFPNFLGYRQCVRFNVRIKQVSIPFLGSPSPKQQVFRGNKMWDTNQKENKREDKLWATHVAGHNDTWDSTVEKRYVLSALCFYVQQQQTASESSLAITGSQSFQHQ